MRILLLGASGQVGWQLQRTLMPLGEVIPVSRRTQGHITLDLADLDRLEAALDRESPDIVVNAAAYTAVDQAESEPEIARRINTEVPALLGDWAAARTAAIVHYSTDYVFDGTKDAPYTETDATGPLNVYGRTKLAGDQALAKSNCAAVVLRVSWVYGIRGRNFLLTMMRLMQTRDELRVVDDQFGAPTWCRTIAQATALVLGKLGGEMSQWEKYRGTYHLAPTGRTTWFGFAQAIRDTLGLDCELHPITTDDYPTPAARPGNSVMSSKRLERAFGLELPPWQRDLRLCLDERETLPG